MRTLSKTAVALGLVALLTTPAMAQQGRGRGFGMGGGMGIGMLLSNKSVQQELKLDEGQVEKAQALATKTREKMMAAVEGLEGEERFAKMREVGKEINEEAQKAAKEILKPEQLKRIHQIQHQVQGAQAFADEHVQKELKLTDAQKAEIDGIVQESNGKMRELFGEMQSDPEGTRTKIGELRKETLTKAEGKLTDEQKATWKDLLGSHFEVKWEFGGRGR